MKKIILCLLSPLVLFAQSYMAKVEPYEDYTLYAQTSGAINYADTRDETQVVSKILIKLDDIVEQDNLKLYKEQLGLYNEKLKLFKTNYQKFLKISGKSQYDKDEKYYDILDLKVSISNLKLTISNLQDTINKKSLHVKNKYIKEIKVNVGDYVATGSELANIYDISKSKLIVYVSGDDYVNIKNKQVLINDKENIAQLEKVDLTVDESYVSAHKITLILNDKDFGKIVKVEFK